MNLLDDTWQTFDGEPVAGRIPAKVIVQGDAALSVAQIDGVKAAYRTFTRAQQASLARHSVQHVVLGDGSRVRIERNGDAADRVFVTPPPEGAGLYSLLPAFFVNAPDQWGDTMPDPINSATWTGLPLSSTTPHPILSENFRKRHPGNVTWFDGRPDSNNKGLVLSWWSMAADRYGANWQRVDSSEVQHSPDGLATLYCNGDVIGDLPQAVIGACISLIDGVDTICVATSDTISVSSVTGVHGFRYGQVWGGTGTSAQVRTQQLVRFYHADMPGCFRDGVFFKLTFTLSHSFLINDKDFNPAVTPFTYRTADYVWHQGVTYPTHCIKFNSSGAAGVLPMNGFVRLATAVDGTDPSVEFVTGALLMDPRALDVSLYAMDDTPIRSFLSARFPSKTISTLQLDGKGAWDYKQDTLVYVDGARAVMTETGESDLEVRLIHALEYGIVSATASGVDFSDIVDPFLVPGTDSGSSGTAPAEASTGNGDANITGDLRVDFRYSTGSSFAVGFEGMDSSFDGRLLVVRAISYVHVFIDGTEVTTALNAIVGLNLQNIKYPVLCGPIQWSGGTEPTIPKVYVSGVAP